MVLDADTDPALVQQVLSQGYAADLTEDEVEEIAKDPFIVAYALASEVSTAVVTTEI